MHVSADYFALFGAPWRRDGPFPLLKTAPRRSCSVLSYGLWKSRFACNPNIAGSTIQLDGQPYLVIGVIGRSFVTETPADLWIPYNSI